MKQSDADGNAYERHRPVVAQRAREWYYANKGDPKKSLPYESVAAMSDHMAAQNKRPRGRPRVGDCRIETVVPQQVMALLIRREHEGRGYRTRIAAQVLCEWASRQTGHKIKPHDVCW